MSLEDESALGLRRFTCTPGAADLLPRKSAGTRLHATSPFTGAVGACSPYAI